MLNIEFFSRKQLPVILQTQSTECGYACLAMIAGYHGHEIDLMTLRNKIGVSTRGLDLEQLIDAAGRLNMAARPLRAELEYLTELNGPAILHWDFNHFVVLKSATRKAVTIHDPAAGELTVTWDEVNRHFTGIVIELLPTPGFERKPEKVKFSLLELWGRHRGIKSVLMQVLLYSMALELFAILMPLYMQAIVDQVLVTDDSRLLLVLALGFGLVALIQAITTAIRSWVVLFLGVNLNYQMMSRLFQHLLRLPMSYFESRHLGDLVSRFTSMQEIQRTLSTQFIETVVDGVMTTATLIIMFYYSAALAVAATVMVSLYLGLRAALFGKLYQATEQHLVKEAYTQSNFLETIQGIQGIKLFSKQSLRLSVWQNYFTRTVQAQVKAHKIEILLKASETGLFGVGRVVIIGLGALQVMRGQFTVGMLFAFMAFELQFATSAGKVVEKIMQYKMLGLHAQRVADIALSEPEITAGTSGKQIERAEGHVKVCGVAFRYGTNDPYVLRDVELEAHPGESLAIVGPSGCGKSTLLKVIGGLLMPTEGKVLLDGHGTREIGLLDYRRHFAGVMQDDTLFAGSLLQNIVFFDPRPDEERAMDCARAAAIHDDIVSMPMAYNTLVGDIGDTLSGGQRQRILLARALYHKPAVLLLDEATSNLDVGKEREVSTAIRKLAITRIIVAHRPETIRSADRVFDLAEALMPGEIAATSA